ncbi:unnamed protein product [Bursaphelenchus xylophilus]|uniref:(pine wood nematode) hypothetical protein n=1 Tax=Bursaphelenchus xylophilus TaxID=6326 RepID=A0A1I7SQG0_BURXY|nr:unnamed protein product [Bursaphelenchus xylophilus]CAG9109845.1 unnamed protein product [Bursaphelenchus xylophilus]
MKFLTISFFTLLQFLRPDSTTTPVSSDKCPCVVNPNTNGCLRYDSRFQATSIEEAIDFFEDMTLLFEKKPAEMTVTDDDLSCTSKECKTCRRMMNQRLRQIGFFEDFYGAEGYKNFIEPVEHDSDDFLGTTCSRYRFARNNSDTVDYSKSGSKKKARNVEDLIMSKRFSRQVVDPVNATLIGTRYNLSCTTKGSAPDGSSDSGLLSLCSKCWAWRQLPANYFPQFINELICHDGDTDCLSGYGMCNSGERLLEVLRNDTYKLTTVTLSASSFCECQVKAGSAIQNLVTGEPNK